MVAYDEVSAAGAECHDVGGMLMAVGNVDERTNASPQKLGEMGRRWWI